MNFEVISHFQRLGKTRKLEEHLVPAVRGLYRSIALGPTSHSLQDLLRLLTLWFRYGEMPDVDDALVKGFDTVSIDTWLQVIPQLMARIHSAAPLVARRIRGLLIQLGRVHPQALLFPLSVASKSPILTRIAAANEIFEDLRKHSTKLVNDAFLVSQELIRVAILCHEMWHETILQARAHAVSKNYDEMWKILETLHNMLDDVRTSNQVHSHTYRVPLD